MIPLKLHIAGFLSYRESADLDFTGFELACISGPNGAGKSSLLDAMTWALFGQARKRDESLVNLQSRAAEVSLTFEYEGNFYRVQRTLPRGKSTVLEFQVQNGNSWRPLTEHTTRDTQARIEQILRLDYDTFINASFFLQGKADQFTQQTPNKRKEVLGSILGLEVWEIYKERTAGRRREIERQVGEIEGRLAEIEAELAEEAPRRARLEELETNLKALASARLAQESVLDNIRKTAASLNEQRKLAETLAGVLERSRTALAGLQRRLAARMEERHLHEELTRQADEIETSYKAWQAALEEVRRLDLVAGQFREHDEKRQPLLREIESERARLIQEREGLEAQSAELDLQLGTTAGLTGQIEISRADLVEIEAKLAQRSALETGAIAARERQVELKTENERLRVEMQELKARIEKLQVARGAVCPLCGQSLSEEHRMSTLTELQGEGTSKGDRHRLNQNEMKTLSEQIAEYEASIRELASDEQKRLAVSNTISQLSERLENLERQAREWKKTGAARLKEVTKVLETGKYALPAQKALAKLDKELAGLGYDAAAHDAARGSELELRAAGERLRKLESAREVSRQLDAEIAALQADAVAREAELHEQQTHYETAASALAVAEVDAPNPQAAEDELLRLREQENQVRDEAGAARQKVGVLATLRTRKAEFYSRQEVLGRDIARHRTLERAFGKDGVPALLIEQALPEIETKANELLDRLSDGQMSVRFVTQAEYKDKKRGDLKETLDIQISDGAGLRDYEMYSGGEAFRVNFAIRLALSEVLAQRKGARLQTLVIDEGFGSQDSHGRQRLVEAINLVKSNFSKILVITHLEELKDAFPTRIEVEKTEQGSKVSVS